MNSKRVIIFLKTNLLVRERISILRLCTMRAKRTSAKISLLDVCDELMAFIFSRATQNISSSYIMKDFFETRMSSIDSQIDS